MTAAPAAQRRDLAGHAVGSLIWISAALLLWQKLHFGVDFTDESFYVGTAIAFFRDGIRPVIDEINFSASSAVLVAPFLSFAADLNEGVVLYVRKLYFTFLVIQSIVIYFSVGSLVRPRIAWIACAIPLAFVPLNIPSLSYNTIGGGFLLLATMLAWRAAATTGRTEVALGTLSGICFAIAGAAHPAFGLAGLCACVVNTFAAIPGHRRFGVSQSVGILAGAAACYAMLGMPDPAAVRNSVRYMQSVGSAELPGFAWDVLLARVGHALGPLLSPTVDNVYRDLALWNFLFLALVPVALFLPGRQAHERRAVTVRVMVPACAAGAILSYTSTHGMLNASIATLPATIAAAVWLARWADDREKRVQWVMVLLLAFAVAASTYASRGAYRDGPLDKLEHRVESGPFRGLLTISDKYAFLKAIEADRKALLAAAPEARHILFFDRFPAGYLLVPLTPCTDTLWRFPVRWFPRMDRARTLRAFDTRRCQPDVVFVMHRVPYQTDVFDGLLYSNDDVLVEFIDEGGRYARWRERRDYFIYLRKPLSTGNSR